MPEHKHRAVSFCGGVVDIQNHIITCWALPAIARYNPTCSLLEMSYEFNIECDKEVDGLWISEIPQLPGVLCYGQSKNP
jgi:hypothetical protein